MYDFKLLTGTNKVHYPGEYEREPLYSAYRYRKAKTLCGLAVEEHLVFDLEVNCKDCLRVFNKNLELREDKQ
jgi:hypothetical protein